jgi:hypothetical protein
MKPQTAETLIFLLGQDAEIIPCTDFSRKPTGTPGHFYREYAMKFASAYCYHQQLFRQIKRKKRKGTALANLKQIQLFFVRNKHSKLFTSWAKHQAQHKQPVTKKRILHVIKRFRSQPNLHFFGSRKLPHHLDSACAPYVGCSSEPAFPNRPRSPSKDRKSPNKQDGRSQQNQTIQPSPHGRTTSQQHIDNQAKGGYQHQASSARSQPTNCLTLAGHMPSTGGNTFRSRDQQESRKRNPCHRSVILFHSKRYCFLHIFDGVRKQVKKN